MPVSSRGPRRRRSWWCHTCSSTPNTCTPANRAGSSDAACRHGLMWDHTVFHVVARCRANPAMVAPSNQPTPRAPSKAITGLYVVHQSIWGASHAHQMEALQTDGQITPITTVKRRRAAAGRVRHCRGPLTTAGGRSPLIIKDLDLYPQPPTNTHSPTLNSEEPDSRYQLSAQLHVGRLLAPVGLSATIAAMGPSANHTTRTLIREELFNHTAYEVQIAVTFVPAATSFLRLSFPPVVTSTLCA